MMTAPTTLRQRIQEDMKTALKAGDKRRLGAIRLIVAAIKQREIDERKELDDAEVVRVLDRMGKQRRESMTQYLAAGRPELADQEEFEIGVLQDYLPEALTEEEINNLIALAITTTNAKSMKDMGKVMGELKPKLQGRADIGAVSAQVRSMLGN